MNHEGPHLLADEADEVLIVTLNRPDKLNAITIDMLALFKRALAHFRDTPELKVMLIRATGRYFCSGVDLRQGRAGDIPRTGTAIRRNARLHLAGMHGIYDEMEHIEKPIVVAHQAPCIGGGLELSLSCDFRLAAASATYAFPEGRFGVLPASNGVSRLTRICGPNWARWLVMANLPVDAQRALQMGLVHDVFPDDTFEEDIVSFCRRLARTGREQLAAAKLAIELADDIGAQQGRQLDRLALSALQLDPSFQEVLARQAGDYNEARPGVNEGDS